MKIDAAVIRHPFPGSLMLTNYIDSVVINVEMVRMVSYASTFRYCELERKIWLY